MLLPHCLEIEPDPQAVLREADRVLFAEGCLLVLGGLLATIFLKKFNAHPPYPQRDPRLLEAMGVSPNIVSDRVDANAGGAK